MSTSTPPTRTSGRHTVFPPASPDAEFDRLADCLATSDSPQLIVGDDVVSLPRDVAAALKDVVAALARGQAVTVVPQQTLLTTQEAADLLGISRPTLVKLLDDHAIPFTQPGRHRRVRLIDVLEFREHRSQQRDAGLDELAAVSADAGLYDQHPSTESRSR